MVMQLHHELEMQAGQAEAQPILGRKPKRSRKVTVRLTEELYNRLSAATERPGLGKSMAVEAALERFLSPAPSVEDVVQERFDDMNVRFDRLERDVRMMTETIALHARYHLSVMPVLPQSRQQEAARLGDERFKVLAEQADRRVRLGRPLMQEMIDRLNSEDRAAKDVSHYPDLEYNDQKPAPEEIDIEPASFAAAGEGGSNLYFRPRPNAFSRPS
jgi:hypothetical protein